MSFAVIIRQEGGGCGNRIECGTKIHRLNAWTRAAAVKEAKELFFPPPPDTYETEEVDENGKVEKFVWFEEEDEVPYPFGHYGPLVVELVKLTEIRELPCQEWNTEYLERKQRESDTEERAFRRREYEKLRKEFEGT